MKNLTTLLLISLILVPTLSWGTVKDRFFLSGNGKIKLINTKTGEKGEIEYRLSDGTYSAKGHQEINRLFGIPQISTEKISLRLISLLDYLQDQHRDRPIQLVSGYRSEKHNKKMIKAGEKNVARTSLHIWGMAADIRIKGISAKRLWNDIRNLGCCGAGYYHGRSVHIDTGPVRFWDEKSSKVGQDLGAQNKLILARTDQDIYLHGESVQLSLARITDFPFGVYSVGSLMKGNEEVAKIPIAPGRESCISIPNNHATSYLVWKMPEDFKLEGKFRIQVRFCEKKFSEMPDQIDSNTILVNKK